MRSRVNGYDVLKIGLAIFFTYTIWLQNIYLIPGMLPVLGITILAMSFIAIKWRIVAKDYKQLYFFMLYTLYVIITGSLYGIYKEITSRFMIQHIEYMIPLFSVYIYIQKDQVRRNSLYRIIIIPVVLLCITALINPTNSDGSITVGEMNPNTFATFLTMMIMACFFIISEDRCTKKETLLLYAVIALGFVLTIQAASRRGLLVNSVIIFSCLLLLKKYKYNTLNIRSFLFVVIITGFIIGSLMYLLSHADSIRVFQRLAMKNYQGDIMRAHYQQGAYELFKQNPLIGAGLGAVEGEIGMYSHSMYYELLACTGIIGTSLIVGYFIYILGFFIVNGFRAYSPQLKLHNFLVSIFVLSIMVSGIACTFIYDLTFFIFFAIISSEKSIADEMVRESTLGGEK